MARARAAAFEAGGGVHACAPSSCGTRCLGISTENQFVMSSFSPVWPPTEYEW